MLTDAQWRDAAHKFKSTSSLVQDRNARILELKQQGKSYGQIAQRFGISRQRVLQIIQAEKAKRGITPHGFKEIIIS